MAIKDTLLELYQRDLKLLHAEINLYDNEEHLWSVRRETNNSAGNLCLHLIGNLKKYFGGVLGNSGYVRNREAEFTSRTSKKALLQGIDETLADVVNTLENLSEEKWQEIYPLNVFEKEMTTEFFLVHLACHLNFHLGQINYHRRIIY